MTLVLDRPRRAQGWTVAALCDRWVVGHRGGRALVFAAGKRPVALLLFDGHAISARDLAGRPLDPERLEARCPGALAALRAAAEGA